MEYSGKLLTASGFEKSLKIPELQKVVDPVSFLSQSMLNQHIVITGEPSKDTDGTYVFPVKAIELDRDWDMPAYFMKRFQVKLGEDSEETQSWWNYCKSEGTLYPVFELTLWAYDKEHGQYKFPVGYADPNKVWEKYSKKALGAKGHRSAQTRFLNTSVAKLRQNKDLEYLVPVRNQFLNEFYSAKPSKFLKDIHLDSDNKPTEAAIKQANGFFIITPRVEFAEKLTL